MHFPKNRRLPCFTRSENYLTTMENKVPFDLKKAVFTKFDMLALPASLSELDNFELNTGITLPDDYKRFLKISNGACSGDISLFIESDARDAFGEVKLRNPLDSLNSISEQSFFYISTVPEMMKSLDKDYIPNSTSMLDYKPGRNYANLILPVGLTAASTWICLGISGKYTGKVYLLTLRENPSYPYTIDDWLVQIADSFERFIEILVPCNEESAMLIEDRARALQAE